MDQYTKKTKIWLDKRFRYCNAHGVYHAHQPIYGFRDNATEPGHLRRYIRTYQIVKALSHLKFGSLLDVGGAEGYTANIIKNVFGIKVWMSDLSEEACKRAKQIFDINSVCADIHALPFGNNEFDIVLCSETLEHVFDLNKAISEILRVAKRAIVITVPLEDQESVKGWIGSKKPHAHIHAFTFDSFDALKSNDLYILRKKMDSSVLKPFFTCIQAEKIRCSEKIAPIRLLLKSYNFCTPILRRLFGERTLSLIILMDSLICDFNQSCNGILFTILKDKSSYSKREVRKISAYRIVNFKVPYCFITGDPKP